MVESLEEDHKNARVLAEGLAELPGLQIDLETVQTNLVIFAASNGTLDESLLPKRLAREGVKIGDLGRGRLRAVTHYGLTKKHMHDALQIIGQVWKEMSSKGGP